jgi:hypothetical protein
MRNIFKNSAHQEQYNRDGFIRYPLLSSQEVADLLAVYKQLNSGLEGNKFYTSHTSGDVAYKTKVDQAIKEVLVPKLGDIFEDYKPVFGFYLVKSQGSETLDLHLDWQFVDERQHVGFNMWCPLVDVNKENGALFAIPGSHKQIKILRGYNTPNPMWYVDGKVDESQVQTLPLKAGEALIFDLRLVHGARPNTLPQQRIAVGMVAIPQEADILHFWAEKEERSYRDIEVYKMQPEYYMLNHNGQRPPAESLIGHWDDTLREQTIADLKKAYTQKPSFIKRLFGALG